MTTMEILCKANAAKSIMYDLPCAKRNLLLHIIAEGLLKDTYSILLANKQDIEFFNGELDNTAINKLTLIEQDIALMAENFRHIAEDYDLSEEAEPAYIDENGTETHKVRIPIGVIAIMHDKKVDYTANCIAMCIKSANVCIIRGGYDNIRTNEAIVTSIRKSISSCGVSPEIVSLVADIRRESAIELIRSKGFVDLLIPVGSDAFVQFCAENTTVPCIQISAGICHIYIDRDANTDKAVDIVCTSKTSDYLNSNSVEVCIVHTAIASEFLPKLALRMAQQNVELRLCPLSAQFIEGTLACDDDFKTEFSAPVLAVKIVDTFDEAVEYINLHSSMNADGIVTQSSDTATKFCNSVNSVNPCVNVPTSNVRSGMFGFDAVIGVSHQKNNSRGFIGIEQLTSYKYITMESNITC